MNRAEKEKAVLEEQRLQASSQIEDLTKSMKQLNCTVEAEKEERKELMNRAEKEKAGMDRVVEDLNLKIALATVERKMVEEKLQDSSSDLALLTSAVGESKLKFDLKSLHCLELINLSFCFSFKYFAI